ncbi:Bardet-Biedl syndrome 12 protein [Scophthalmus maximus]|uniref:Bardet-Biedl syndrome 12 protein n=1 Tax=Scophthalmus maximus TaxID=52904 RepID=A0A6A4TCQ5_SCOMX|nr:Bardet-Biedl syndrome 12 protein [Scophthalmus maximus]XP_035506435.2 Bardet-Biedl syndrome 12 protein [Scophthalmus maximus]XP_035506436.2 Bardet-Biedl syndrome 12 protein [Scophthalmus maximus]KAF0039982.1 hypothetical protein F2P81_008217 [Scophthalmus maximus]
MLGSTVINHRQHVGLQELSALAGVTHSFLGPDKTYKFIQDDASGESALVRSCFRLFENLELTCAVGQLVHETIQAHQRVYGTGSGCLLFLAGAWSRAAVECLQRGISVPHVVAAMSEAIEVCEDVCRICSISIEGLGATQSEEGGAATPHGSGLQLSKKSVPRASRASCHKTLNISGQRKIKLSRHFYEAEAKTQPDQPEPPNITYLADALSHGCVDAMNLAVEANRLQSKDNQDVGCSTFDVTKVLTCVVPGLPEERSCVLPGCVVLLSVEQASVALRLREQPVNVALINGDLSHDFRHLGFKRPAGIQQVSDRSALLGSSPEEEWLVKVVALLLNLELNLILVSGLASEKVIQRCCGHRILVVEKAKASVLKAFADATGGVPVTYATQLTKHCVGTGAKVATWRELHESATAVNISARGNGGLVTVVLTSCVRGKLQALEDQFWACAHRLHRALKDRAVLPGAGATEMLCVRRLQKRAGHRSETSGAPTEAEGAVNPYRGEVFRLMADGLIDYVSTVMFNTGRFSKVKARTALRQQLQECNGHVGTAAKFSQVFSEGENEDGAFVSEAKPAGAPSMKVYDNLSVKQEAWRKALDLVLLVLQTDAEVVTGVEQKTAAEENLMLL